ncbi:hypothetical protein LUCX_81 [Xanthomonas phage vB_XciM_LucasX]|nr:hypothetical protein LUCX_81 [Xanthomonas phage vB_XciM_LucasX]
MTEQQVFEMDGEVSEEQWALVLADAPAMDRLPAMVVDHFGPAIDAESESVAEAKMAKIGMENSVRLGVCFLHQAFGARLNTLFEQYDLHIGTAVEMFLEDLLLEFHDSLEEGSEIDPVENYSSAEICGRFLGYLVLNLYHEEFEDVFTDAECDVRTGYYPKFKAHEILLKLPEVLHHAQIEPELLKAVRYNAQMTVHLMMFSIMEPDKSTIWH